MTGYILILIGFLYYSLVFVPAGLGMIVGHRVRDELFWFAHEDAPFRAGKMLIDEAVKRIKERGAWPIFHSLETSPKSVGKLYQKMGLQKMDTQYMGVF